MIIKIIIIGLSILFIAFICLTILGSIVLGGLKEKEMRNKKDANAIIDRLYEIEIELGEKPENISNLLVERSELEQILIEQGREEIT